MMGSESEALMSVALALIHRSSLKFLCIMIFFTHMLPRTCQNAGWQEAPRQKRALQTLFRWKEIHYLRVNMLNAKGRQDI